MSKIINIGAELINLDYLTLKLEGNKSLNMGQSAYSYKFQIENFHVRKLEGYCNNNFCT
jgi:hypothetical protein